MRKKTRIKLSSSGYSRISLSHGARAQGLKKVDDKEAKELCTIKNPDRHFSQREGVQVWLFSYLKYIKKNYFLIQMG